MSFQLGISLNGLTVCNTNIGGPAHNILGRGDIILGVDGKDATIENVRGLLVGDDVPGTSVTIAVSKTGSKVIIYTVCPIGSY